MKCVIVNERIGDLALVEDSEAPQTQIAGLNPVCRKLTPNIHSSHDLNRPEANRFRAKLTNLNIPKIDL